jgi:hypothetical protein
MEPETRRAVRRRRGSSCCSAPARWQQDQESTSTLGSGPGRRFFSMAGVAGLGGRDVLAEQRQQGQQQCRGSRRDTQPGAGCQQEKQQKQPYTGAVCGVRCAVAIRDGVGGMMPGASAHRAAVVGEVGPCPMCGACSLSCQQQQPARGEGGRGDNGCRCCGIPLHCSLLVVVVVVAVAVGMCSAAASSSGVI